VGAGARAVGLATGADTGVGSGTEVAQPVGIRLKPTHTARTVGLQEEHNWEISFI
jgi:hypothetical protein